MHFGIEEALMSISNHRRSTSHYMQFSIYPKIQKVRYIKLESISDINIHRCVRVFISKINEDFTPS